MHAHASKTHAKTIFAYIHEKKQNRLFEKKRLYSPPPPPTPPSPTLSVGAAFSRSKPQKNLGSITWRDLVVVVAVVVGNIVVVAVGVGVGVVVVVAADVIDTVMVLLLIFILFVLLLLLLLLACVRRQDLLNASKVGR